MNINIILDSEYICKELSNQDSAIRIANLFMIMHKKSNIIILQDKQQEIITSILHQLAYNFEKIEKEDLSDAQAFVTELAKGTNDFDFITEEYFENDIIQFVNKLKEKDYPVKIIISDKKIDSDIETYAIEDASKIFDYLENYSHKHTVSNNTKLNNDSTTDKKILDFNEYKDVLFNTFWCSDKITIVAREFFDGAFNSKPHIQELNREKYAEGFNFLFDCLKSTEKFTKKKMNVEIITGLKHFDVDSFKLDKGKKVDELYEYLNNLTEDFNFELKIIKWDAGNERFVGEGHGRRIYSEYGGFDTGFMPFEMHDKDKRTGDIFYKDTSFHWINKTSYIEWNKIGYILEKRPKSQ